MIIRAFIYDSPLILTYKIHCTSKTDARHTIGGIHHSIIMLGNFMLLSSVNFSFELFVFKNTSQEYD